MSVEMEYKEKDMNTEKIKIQSIDISKQYMNNCKVHRMLTIRKFDYMTPIKFNLDKRQNKYVSLDLDNDPSKELPQQFTPFDGAITDTIYSIYKAGYDYFTIEQVAKVFIGNTQKKVTPKLVEKIDQSIKMMANIPQCTIDLENESDRELVKEKKLYGYVLPIEYVKEDAVYATNGKATKHTLFHLLKTPILYEYAERKGKKTGNGEIICIDRDLLDTSDTKNSDTVEYTLLKRYILKRIKQIKHNKNSLKSKKISLEWEKGDVAGGLLAELGYDSTSFSNWNKKRHELIKDIKDILNYYISTGEIKGYETYNKAGTKTIKGFEIKY